MAIHWRRGLSINWCEKKQGTVVRTRRSASCADAASCTSIGNEIGCNKITSVAARLLAIFRVRHQRHDRNALSRPVPSSRDVQHPSVPCFALDPSLSRREQCASWSGRDWNSQIAKSRGNATALSSRAYKLYGEVQRLHFCSVCKVRKWISL
jgi:hypothetical protein